MLPIVRAAARAVLLLAALTVTHVAAQTSQPAFLTKPLGAEVEILFKGFRGHDPWALSGALMKRLEAAPKKSEFETMAAFEDRQQKWRAQPITKAIRFDSRLAFVAPLARITAMNDLTRIKFNAETATLTVQMMNECGNGAGVVWSDESKKIGSYVGTNAFGVKKTITRIFRSTLCLRFTGQPDWLHFHEPFKVDAETAKAMVKTGHLVLIGSLFEPFRESELDTSKPTINDPYEVTDLSVAVMLDLREVVIADPATGRIFLRVVKPE